MGYTDVIIKKDYTEARIQKNRADFAEATADALIRVRDELVKVLAEVAPNHPLVNKENRNKIYRDYLASKGYKVEPKR